MQTMDKKKVSNNVFGHYVKKPWHGISGLLQGPMKTFVYLFTLDVA